MREEKVLELAEEKRLEKKKRMETEEVAVGGRGVSVGVEMTKGYAGLCKACW